jgi:hypothetical protein
MTAPERIADEVRDAPEEAENFAMVHWVITAKQSSTRPSPRSGSLPCAYPE